MSDKVLVERELLERLLEGLDKGFPLLKVAEELRALLSEQPQACAAQSAHDQGEVQRLREVLVKRIQAAISSVVVPATLTQSRAEYYKAGARHIIAKVNEALSASTEQEV